jgi:hypothetical protein
MDDHHHPDPRESAHAKEIARGVLHWESGSEARIERLETKEAPESMIRLSRWTDDQMTMSPLELSESDLMKLIAEGIRKGVLRGDVRRRLWTPMTLPEVLARAAEMNPAERWEWFTLCGQHDIVALPRTSTAVMADPPHFCPTCLTVFAATGFKMWNPPVRPFDATLTSGPGR